MDTTELVERLSVALAIGLLIGIERGWQARSEKEGERAAGLRTHALAALLGGIWGAIAVQSGEGGLVALGVAFLTFSAAIALFRYRENVHDGTFGATTVVASMLAFTLGAYAVYGDRLAAAAAGVAVAGLLALKSALHGWVARLSFQELRSGLLLLAMTFIMLPLLPDRTVDPWASVNPYELWLMTVILAAISFAGYVAIKIAGDRGGSVITGIAGGLASSTAVTVTLSRLAREHPTRRTHLVAGVLLSGATMMARVLAVVALFNAALLPKLVAPIGLAAATLVAAGAVFLLRRDNEDRLTDSGALQLVNPFELATVLKLGALLTVVTVAAKLLTTTAGAAGAYALAAVSGLADVDAVTLSMARLGAGQLDPSTAARAILLVVLVNTLAKATLGWVTGGASVGRLLAGVSLAAVVSGVAGFALFPA